MGLLACELCGKRSTLLCLADEANLCWGCDASVHSANFLVARHVRSLLCKRCGNETECRTSGSHPFPLERSCAACDPAYVHDAVKDKEPNVGESMDWECDVDSDNPRATGAVILPKRAIGNGMDSSPPTQESHTHSRNTVEDVQSSKESQGWQTQCKRARRSTGRSCDTKGTFVGHANGAQPIKKARLKRSQSPVSVISLDVSHGTCDGEDPVESVKYSSLAAWT